MLRIGNPANWELIYDQEVRTAAELIPDRIFDPIPPITAPILVDKPILAVVADCPKAKPNWRLACWVTPLFATGTAFGLVEGDRQVIQIRRSRLVSFYPKLADTYQIRFDIPPWHNVIRLTVYAYIGKGAPIVGVLENNASLDLPNLDWLTQ